VLGSNDPGFGPGNVELLSETSLGFGTARDGVNMKTSLPGRYELPFCTEQNGQKRHVLAGTTPLITYEAFSAVQVVE
jgi:hypothetical protein